MSFRFDAQAALESIRHARWPAGAPAKAANVATVTEGEAETVATLATVAGRDIERTPAVRLGRARDAVDLDAFAERAAIAEIDGGLDRAAAETLAAQDQGFDEPDHLAAAALTGWRRALGGWSDGLARLSNPDPRWQQLLHDAQTFLTSPWAPRAMALGWEERALFGLHPRAPFARYEARGLVPALEGRRLLCLSESCAAMQAPSGARLSLYRAALDPYREAVPFWGIDL